MTSEYEQYVADAAVLAQIGRAMFVQPTRVKVRLPRALADLAVAAWARVGDTASPDNEPVELATARRRAGTLALIGLSIEDGATSDGDDIIVELEAWFVGSALDAAGDAGLLADVRPPA